MLKMCLVEFSLFFRGGGGGVDILDILSKILYIYVEIKVFKAQMGYGGTQKCKIKTFSEGF